MEEVKALRVLDELSRVNIDNPNLTSILESKILFDHSLYSLPDCPVRRRFFSVVECFLIALWQKSYFGCKYLDDEIQHILPVFGILKDVVQKINFNTGVEFSSVFQVFSSFILRWYFILVRV